MEYVKGGEEKLDEANSTSHVQLDEAIADVNTISSSPLHNSDQPISLIHSVFNFFMRNVCLRFFFKRKEEVPTGFCPPPTFRRTEVVPPKSCAPPTFRKPIHDSLEMTREGPLINEFQWQQLSCIEPTFVKTIDDSLELTREGSLINEVGTTFILRHRANLTESKEVLNHPDEVIGKADAVCENCWIPFSVNEDITKMKCKCEFFFFHETCVPKMGNACSTCLQQVEGIPLTLLQFQDLAVDGTSKQNEKKPRKFLLFK